MWEKFTTLPVLVCKIKRLVIFKGHKQELQNTKLLPLAPKLNVPWSTSSSNSVGHFIMLLEYQIIAQTLLLVDHIDVDKYTNMPHVIPNLQNSLFNVVKVIFSCTTVTMNLLCQPL